MNATFCPVFKEAYNKRKDYNTTTFHKRALTACCETTPTDHPRLWHALEHTVAHRYERMTGNVLPEGVDWASIKSWLVEHWPQIVSMLCSLIMLFIAL